MLIRIATFNRPPTDDREWVIDAIWAVPSVRAAYHVVDRETGAKKVEIATISTF